MLYLTACFVVFLAAYTLNMVYLSVFYHRALTHGAIKLHPALEWVVVHSGNWITGIDPKAWICMHRMHHEYSDTPLDPHTPSTHGIWRVLPMQLNSYNKTIVGLMANKGRYASKVSDLNFGVHWLNKRQLWYLPYVLHAVIAVAIGIYFHAWLLAAGYWIGMMSHPVQGWMVNALAHRFGYRNFATDDNSKNNSIVAWLVFGEGYQNNHHKSPASAKFSVRRSECDFGFGICVILSSLGLLKITSKA